MSNRMVAVESKRAITQALHDASLQNHIIGVLAPPNHSPSCTFVNEHNAKIRLCLALSFHLAVAVYCKSQGAVNQCDASSWLIMHWSWCRFSHKAQHSLVEARQWVGDAPSRGMEHNSWSPRAPVVASFPGYLASSHHFHPDKDLRICACSRVHIFMFNATQFTTFWHQVIIG